MAGKRRYSTTLRVEQTRLARSRILDAASGLFTERGYLGTTLQQVATEAGVSVQTVYNVVGGKPVLLKAVHDVVLAGDDEPVPIGERPTVQEMLAATDARTCLALYAQLGRELGERTLPLLTTLYAQAATGDPDLTDYIDTTEGDGPSAPGGRPSSSRSGSVCAPGSTSNGPPTSCGRSPRRT